MLVSNLVLVSNINKVSSRSTLDSLHGKPGQVLMCVHAALQFVLNAGLKSHGEVFVILGDLIDVCAVSAQIRPTGACVY